MQQDDLDMLARIAYGNNRYIRQDGQRYRVWLARTILPASGDTNSRFEARMERMVDLLSCMSVVDSISYGYEHRDGSIVEFWIEVQHKPIWCPLPAVPEADERPAGGRRTEAGQRGQRGRSQRLAA
ncbi:MAG TPA: hypothetical protein VFS21_03070 [Roseiflexaceae bacterium]|nr:hypothetical protein [Roseiflexaceae bacterium]